MQRTIAYVDGFNLYFGLRSKRWQRYYWLNVKLLIRNLLKAGQQLARTKYFTSLVSSTPSDPHKNKRQTAYLEALATEADVQLFHGHYLRKVQSCRECGSEWNVFDEKMTDVNIATELLVDAFQDSFDLAILLSADGDLTGPILRARELFPRKRVVVAFPPGRVSERLKSVADAYFVVGRKKLADSQFPDEVAKPDGTILRRPTTWR
jgi:uncharacterized LabA/DUF88 family protein